MECRTVGLRANINRVDSGFLVGVISDVSGGNATIRFGDFEHTFPLAAQLPVVFYHLSPGQRLVQDHPVTIRQWALSLRGGTLSVTTRYGTTEIGVGA